MTLTDSIKNEARRLGFPLVGITGPEPPPHFSFYESWLAAGHHGEMQYLATDRARQARANPKVILPDCKAILVLGIHYEPPAAARPESQTPGGRIAAYAWGDDYHLVLKPRLQALVNFIEEQVGHPVANRWYTDTGPVLEREFAQRAGLGWIGKNTCLINPNSGSYFLIAEILLDLQLDIDPPFTTDHCGSCTRCIEACPTRCILPDRTLDSRRCLSYLTIENKGSIPIELRSQMQDWVFGCDICQQVCPWNIRFAAQESDPALSSRIDLAFPDLHQELTLTPEDFNKKFKNHPAKRSKRRGYLRNVATALGISGSKDSIFVLAKAVNDHEPLVRSHAAWALGQIGGEPAIDTLRIAYQQEKDTEVLAEIYTALKNLSAI